MRSFALDEHFIAAMEERLDAIRRRLRQRVKPAPSPTPFGPLMFDQEFIDEMRWRISIANQIQEIERLINEHDKNRNSCVI